jgi:hypothetical protein
VHPRTADVAAALRRAEGTGARLAALRGAYEGERGVVVTCGPSLAGFDPDRLRSALEGSVVFAVKQAVDVTAAETDVLCFNTYNVSKYTVPSKDTWRVFCSEPSGKVPQLNRHDLRLALAPHSRELDDTLVARRDFDAHLLESVADRPWGPGILHEVVFYLAIHLGLRELITVGWDIANARGNNIHFYDRGGDDNFFDRGRADAYKMVDVRRRLPGPLRDALRWGRTALVHTRGGVYNRTTMIPGESEVVAESTGATAEWLARHGVALSVVGDTTLVDPSVPRISQSDFYDLCATDR